MLNLKNLKFFLIIFLFSGSANAALIDRGNGMIYDTYLDITWMADANYAKTSGYDDDGLMTWDQATTWADSLEYGGYNDWMLFSNNWGNAYCYWANSCKEHHLSSLRYTLGVDKHLNSGDSLINSILPGRELFTNIQSGMYLSSDVVSYWSGNVFVSDAVMLIHGDSGFRMTGNKNTEYFAWAVREGDVAMVSAPATMGLLLVGGLGLCFGKTRRLNSLRGSVNPVA